MWPKRLSLAPPWVELVAPAVSATLGVAAIALAVVALRRGLDNAWPALVVAALLVACCAVVLVRRRQLTERLAQELARRVCEAGKLVATAAVATGVAQSQEWLMQGAEAISGAGSRAREIVTDVAADVAESVSDGLVQGVDAVSEVGSRAREAVIDAAESVAHRAPAGVNPSSSSRSQGVSVAHGVWTAQASTCPVCGRLQRQGARFCDGCGMVLPRVCPSCGASQRGGAVFCYQCGASLTQGDAARSQGLDTAPSQSVSNVAKSAP